MFSNFQSYFFPSSEAADSKMEYELIPQSSAFDSPEKILQTAKSGYLEKIKRLMEYLTKTDQLEKIESLTDEDENTILHLAVLHNTPDVVKCIVDKLGKHAIRVCRVVNDEGHIPLILADQITNFENRRAVIEILLPITTDIQIRKISEPINIDKLLSQYPEAKLNEELTYNLKVGCEAVNLCRQIISTSFTHPALNTCTIAEQADVSKKLIKLRKDLREKKFSLENEEELMKILHARTQAVKNVEVANCDEFSQITLALLSILSNGHNTHIERVNLKGGDHVFNIIGRNPQSKLSEPEKWGPNAVIVDAWSGEVYPTSRLKEKLMNYHFIQYNDEFKLSHQYVSTKKSYNVLSHFNEGCHKISSLTNLELSGSKNLKTRGSIKNRMEQSLFAEKFIKGETVPDAIQRGTKRKPENDMDRCTKKARP